MVRLVHIMIIIFVVIHFVKRIVSHNISTSSAFFYHRALLLILFFFSHVHLFKYDNIKYSSITLGYTRIGLGDANNNSFYFQHCRIPQAITTCFHILKESNKQETVNNCYSGNIPSDEIEDHEYKWYEPLTMEKSKNNRVLLSKTDNLMPHFVDNFLRFATTYL